MKRRILGIMVSASLLLAMSVFPSQVEAATRIPSRQALASTIDNISQTAGNLNVDSADSNNVQFGTVTVNGANVEIIGSLGTDTSSSFDLVGTLSKGIVSTRVDGELTDKLNNFTVERFELLSDPDHSILMNQNLTGEVLALYLEENGTKNVSFIECQASSVFTDQQLSDITSNYNNYAKAPKSVSLWEEKMFHPDSHTKKTIENPSTNSLATNNLVSSPIPMTNVQYPSYTDSYSDSYYIFGYNVTDTIDVGYSAAEPSADGLNIMGELSVQGYDWNESNGTDLKNVETGFELGSRGTPAQVVLSVSSPAGIESQLFDGKVEHVGNGSISATICWGIPYTPICLTLNFPDIQSETITGNGTATQSLTMMKGTATSSAKLSNSAYLQVQGDNLTSQWNIGTTGSAKTANITAAITYLYDLYNTNNEDDWGQQFDNLSWTMQS
jgi:hypothetical protein